MSVLTVHLIRGAGGDTALLALSRIGISYHETVAATSHDRTRVEGARWAERRRRATAFNRSASDAALKRSKFWARRMISVRRRNSRSDLVRFVRNNSFR